MFLVKLVDEEVLDLEDVANCCTDGSKVTFKQVDETLGTARLGCFYCFFDSCLSGLFHSTCVVVTSRF